MRGDQRVLEFLNEQLTAELTAINQYFLHGKMQENLGWVKLARHTRAEAIEERKSASFAGPGIGASCSNPAAASLPPSARTSVDGDFDVDRVAASAGIEFDCTNISSSR